MSLPLDQYARQLEQTMLTDRHRLRRQLRELEAAEKRGKVSEKRLKSFADQLERSFQRAEKRRALLPVPKFSGDLPIDEHREEIKQAIEAHPVVIVCGETGSGKSTQLPKICLEMGRGVYGLIGHTQPRRLAARSVAARVAEELETTVGEHVGFKIRFTDLTKPSTFIKLMTDGILLAETRSDRFLNAYETLIIDEAHERSLNIDFLLGYVKRLLLKRPEFRLIITSATIDAARFSEHFSINEKPAPVLHVEGRTYPVEVRYRPPKKTDEGGEADWRIALTDAVDELTLESRGDILTFLPTEREIREAAKVLRGHLTRTRRIGNELEVLPLYGRLSEKEQRKIFQPHNKQRIVLATNVAESSLTVPGIETVIDLGTARISRYSPRSKMQRLPIEAVSKASANQRKGRCGRTSPGICIRLYSEKDFDTREEFTPPEIQRTNLAHVILQTISLNLGPLHEFPFLDPPRGGMVRDGHKTLFELGAIDEKQQLTDIGRQLAKFPVDPRIGRMILAGHDENCMHEILIIASSLETQDVRDRPVELRQAADQAHAQFKHESSDFIGLLKLWDFYQHLKRNLSHSKFRKACKQNFLSYNRLKEWGDIHRQLMQLVEEAKLPIRKRKDNEDAVHRALLTGLLSNVAFLEDKKEYVGSGGAKRFIWPGSGLHSKKPKWITSAEMIETSQRYALTVARINPAWIEPLAKHLVKLSHSEPHWDQKTGSTMAWERVTLFGMTIIPRRHINYGRVDSEHARELMIRDGLATGEIETHGDFLSHNLSVVEEVRKTQAKIRRHDFGSLEQIVIEFYDERVPEDCYDLARFEQWRKKIEVDHPQKLFLSVSDLAPVEEKTLDRGQFPDALVFENLQLPLSYHLQPGEEDDGVTVTVTVDQLHHLRSELLDWLVPGLVEEKIAALIKTLPKSLRTKLVPAPDTAREVGSQIAYGQGPFLQTITAHLQRIAGEPVSPDAFDLEAIPRHLQMNMKVIDKQEQPLGTGRNLLGLQQQFSLVPIRSNNSSSTGSQKSQQAGPKLSTLAKQTKWHRDHLTKWEFDQFPDKVEIRMQQYVLTGYPCLIDTGKEVQLRLLESSQEAKQKTEQGLFRLFCIAAESKINHQLQWYPDIEKLELASTVFPGFKNIRSQLRVMIAQRAFPEITKIPQTQQQYKELFQQGINNLSPAVQEVAQVTKPLHARYREVLKQIKQLHAPIWNEAKREMQQQLEMLIGPQFLAETDWDFLTQFPRYLQAIQARCKKLMNAGLEKDRIAMQELAPFLRRMIEGYTSSTANEPEFIAYRMMLEEYRVSLFAQQLGTAQSVSPKRLERQWKKAIR